MKKFEFKKGDKVTLVSMDKTITETANWIKHPYECNVKQGDEFTLLHDTIKYGYPTKNRYIDLEELKLSHPAEKFRLSKYVERVKWTLVDASELNRGDIVKPSLNDNIKHIVLSKEKGMLKLLPAAPISNTRPDGYIQKEDGTIRFYLVGSFYKLINISEL